MKLRITRFPEPLDPGDFGLRRVYGSEWVKQVRAFVKQNGSFTTVDLNPPDAEDMLFRLRANGCAADFAP